MGVGPLRQWMRLALEQAHAARAMGEVPVGAVLLDAKGQLIAAGHNRPIAAHDPSAHAEIDCLRRAGQALGNYRFPGSTLVVTLEPCTMCAGAIVHARVGTVVFGAYDPKAGAAGSHSNFLLAPGLNHQPEICGGILAVECGQVLRGFFRARRQKISD